MAKRRDGPVRDATRDDVARLAGVSSAVVSYVVNNGPRPVAPATRQRVLEAIDKLGYRPNTAARSLITGRSGLIGLIVPDVENPYFAALAKAVETEASARDLRMVLAQSTSEDLPDLLDSLAGHQLDGVIAATLPPARLLARPAFGRIRIVKLSLNTPLDPLPAVWPDFYGGAQSAVRHLVETHGHQEIALVTGSDQLDVRERAWRDSLTGFGLRPGPVVRIPWSAAGGWAAAEALAGGDVRVSGVFVTSDQQAVGFLAGLHRGGIVVPEDIAVVSFDGSPASEFTMPALTTVGVPFRDMAGDAIDALLGSQLADRTYSTALVVRESCGCTRPPRHRDDQSMAVTL